MDLDPLAQQIGAAIGALAALALAVRRILRAERFEDVGEGLTRRAVAAATEIMALAQRDNDDLRARLAAAETKAQQLDKDCGAMRQELAAVYAEVHRLRMTLIGLGHPAPTNGRVDPADQEM